MYLIQFPAITTSNPFSPFNGGFMLFLFYLPISPMSGQAFYWSTILVLFTLVWTDFNVDKYIIGMNLQCCCIWISPRSRAFNLDSIPIKMTYSSLTILLYFRSILVHFHQKFTKSKKFLKVKPDRTSPKIPMKVI